ncbi:MAG: immune inhibitor A [Bacteroidetes bacterium]|nr:immune inhibitor A [Bacteroidota bacterium]
MKYILLPALISAIFIILLSADFKSSAENISDSDPLSTYTEVKINITSKNDIQLLQQNDITVEHYSGNISTGITLVINQEELARLKNTGLNYDVVIPDVGKYYAGKRAPSINELQKSFEIMNTDNVTGFSFGSMGGFYTYNEVVQKLDSMRLVYPNLISVKQNIGTTAENRTIWAVKISDNPDVNESSTEPSVYFDALHHAREPQAMACAIYFMYYLLENYGTNPEVTYLLNNREIFFVPVVNADGYVYNQTTNPNGGGSWRKNRRNNGSCFGVDLNRNYPYGWGDNTGSSSDPCSETYRGPVATSEPEAQAVINFVQQIRPKISFSMHSVAGRYLNPYGYNDSAINYEIYSEFSSDFASSNNYTYGTVSEMLNYYSSGTTRDYMHSVGTYAWTPEVGGTGFWNSQSQIIPVASENVYAMKYLSWVAGAFTDFQNYRIPGSGYVQRNDTLSLEIGLKNRGLSQTAKNVTVEVTTNYPNAVPLNTIINYDSIPARQSKYNISNAVKFRLTSAANYMDEMNYFISVKQEGIQTSFDTIKITVGKTVTLFSDNAENGRSHWTTAGTGVAWDTTFIDPVSGNKNFADSRYGNSADNTNNTFMLLDTIDLTGVNNPRIEFTAKWADEVTFDYSRIQVSSNFGSTWTSMNGRNTRVVSGQPSFTDIKHWRNEQINLNAFIGQRIKIRFTHFTDGGVPGDGFYFDNFRVVDYRDIPTSVSQTSASLPLRYSLSQNFPNPFNPRTVISYELQFNSFAKLVVYDVLGNEVAVLVNEKQDAGNFSVEFDASGYASGIYFYKLTAGNFVQTKKMSLVK